LAVYLSPKHAIKQEQLEEFYNTLGHQFITGGDYNAKHTDWRSRLISPRGREVLKTMKKKKLKTPHHANRNVFPGSQQQRPTPSNRRGQVSRAAP
jgi:hypothetical protein